MKKILILSAILAFTSNMLFAAQDAAEMSAIDSLRAQGYSEQTLKIYDNINYMNKHGNYETYYVDKQQHPIGKFYTKVKLYTDIAQDDGEFGMHEINYSNSFFGNETDYTTRKVKRSDVENL